MYETNAKIREKISFVRDIMDYKMREFLIKAYDLAFRENFGENWVEEYLEIDKKKTHKIAAYENNECVWTNGLRHADFVAAIKILIYSDKKYQEAFCKYWGLDKNQNDRKILLIARELHAFRNDISHINDETDYSILTPDRAIDSMCTLVNLCEGLRDDNGYLYSDIFASEYKRYKVMSKTFYIAELIGRANLHISQSAFVDICRKYNIELSLDEQFVAVDDEDRLISMVLAETTKLKRAKRRKYIWGTLILIVVVLIGVLLTVSKCGHILDNDYGKDSASEVYEHTECFVSLDKQKISDEGVLITIDISNGNSAPITTDMLAQVEFSIVEKDGSKKNKVFNFKISEQIESKNVKEFDYEIGWDKLEIEKDNFEELVFEDGRIIKNDE